MAWNLFQSAWQSKSAAKFNLITRRHSTLWVFEEPSPRLEGLAVVSGYDAAEICAFKRRIHIFQGLKLLYVRRALPIPHWKWSLTFEMEFAAKSWFWRCFEHWNVSCCSIRFNDFWRRVSFVVFPQPARERKEKTKINFQVFLYNHHKGITEALWKAFRSIWKILHTSVPRKGSPT